MNCLLADDNELSLITFRALLSQVSDVEVVAECKNAIEAFDYLKNNRVDFAILDVEMPGMTGMELVKALASPPVIILATANPQYAADAFELDVADYIVKPVSLPRLLKSIEKVRSQVKNNGTAESTSKEFLFIKDKGVIKKIKTEDIVYAEAMGDYVKIHCDGSTHTVGSSISDFEEKNRHTFIRVHRSYLVALKKIDRIDEGMIYAGKARIPLAESYRKKVIAKLNLF